MNAHLWKLLHSNAAHLYQETITNQAKAQKAIECFNADKIFPSARLLSHSEISKCICEIPCTEWEGCIVLPDPHSHAYKSSIVGGESCRFPCIIVHETLRHLAIMCANRMHKKRKLEAEMLAHGGRHIHVTVLSLCKVFVTHLGGMRVEFVVTLQFWEFMYATNGLKYAAAGHIFHGDCWC